MVTGSNCMHALVRWICVGATLRRYRPLLILSSVQFSPHWIYVYGKWGTTVFIIIELQVLFGDMTVGGKFKLRWDFLDWTPKGGDIDKWGKTNKVIAIYWLVGYTFLSKCELIHWAGKYRCDLRFQMVNYWELQKQTNINWKASTETWSSTVRCSHPTEKGLTIPNWSDH